MAEIKSINIYDFWLNNGRRPDPVDYVRLIKADKGSLSECDPTAGKLFLVTDVKVKVETGTCRGVTSYEWRPNVVQTKWGPATGGRGEIIAEGSLQKYNRDSLIDELLKEGRIRECGKYNSQGWELSKSFVRDEIRPIMDQDYAIENERLGRGTQPQPWEPKPHPRNTVPLEKLRQYGLYIGTEIFRVLPGEKITCLFGVAYENDEITAACIGQIDPEESARTAVKSGLIEKVGKFARSQVPWEEGRIVPIYDKGKEPKYPAWREEFV
jgi:hypothetical protein